MQTQIQRRTKAAMGATIAAIGVGGASAAFSPVDTVRFLPQYPGLSSVHLASKLPLSRTVHFCVHSTSICILTSMNPLSKWDTGDTYYTGDS